MKVPARVVLLLAGVFVSMSLVVCGLAFCQTGGSLHTQATLEQVTEDRPPAVAAAERGGYVTAAPPPRPVRDVCPQHRGGVTLTAPDRATTARVNAAWKPLVHDHVAGRTALIDRDGYGRSAAGNSLT